MAETTQKSSATSIDRAVWIDLMRCMLRVRRTEERLIRLYHQGKIYGGVYTGYGQEAIGTACAIAGGPDDLFAPCIRDISVHYARGESVLNVFRQWLGRKDSPTKGRDGNVHYGNLKNGVYAMISHLGAMLPVCVGGVIARRYKGIPAIGVAFIGEGGTSTGDFHEAINFSAVREAPVAFIIENNKYAYSTPTSSQYRCRELVDKAQGYGIEGYQVDGNDAVGMYLTLKPLWDDIRKKPRTVLIECDTMRMRGHGEHDDFAYVPKELHAKYAARDPIQVATTRLVGEGLLTESEIKAIDQACLDEVDRAYKQALSEPPPDPATLSDGVYAP